MNREELASISKKAKEVGAAICGWDVKYFDGVRIDEDGSISVHFSDYRCGDTDTECVCLTEEDLILPISETVSKYKKIAQEAADKLALEKTKRELDEQIRKEKEEYNTYKKLKQKFES